MDKEIMNLLGRKNAVPMTASDFLEQLELPRKERGRVQRTLDRLARAGSIARIKGDRFILPTEADLIPGRISINQQGKGFLQPDEPGLPEILIPPNSTGTALHEDRVLVRREVRPQGLRSKTQERETGSVVRVLERRRERIVGTLTKGKSLYYVIPDDPRLNWDIYVPEPHDVGRPAREGDKVVVTLQAWESRHSNPEGEVVEVLGAPDEEGVDLLAVIRHYDLPLHFPNKVLREARELGATVSEADCVGRVDCRGHEVITIDPEDAKDFDDAICLQPAGDKQWRLWVHIADVSHYVQPGSALDAEARSRGNSTYLVDRVIPMLPEALSNELCSLKPNVDRLTRCVEFLISDDGRVLNAKVHSAVIHSRRRYSYAEVLDILQGSPSGEQETMLHRANQLTQRVRKLRFRAGALALDFPETRIYLDERGEVDRIEQERSDIAHQLIEECMLLANEAVAARLMKTNRPCVYRVHEPPTERRLSEYREEVLSHNIPCGNLMNPPEVQKLLARLDKLPIGPALKIGFLKSLMRARYAPEPLGHYGLAKKHYTHFTSPIRRYADLVVHRALFHPAEAMPGNLKETADHISQTERNSSDAERDSKQVKLYAHLKKQLDSGHPETYEGLVIDLRNFGFFVDVSALGMSGLVPLSILNDDFYELDPSRNQILGRRTRRTIRLGDKLPVQVAKVDAYKKQVDFRLVSQGRKSGDSRPRRQTGRRRGREASGSRGTNEERGSRRRDGAPREGSSQPQDSRSGRGRVRLGRNRSNTAPRGPEREPKPTREKPSPGQGADSSVRRERPLIGRNRGSAEARPADRETDKSSVGEGTGGGRNRRGGSSGRRRRRGSNAPSSGQGQESRDAQRPSGGGRSRPPRRKK